MSSVAPIAGALVAPALALLVYLDGTRRNATMRARLLWAGSVGIASFVAFLAPSFFEPSLTSVYVRYVTPEHVIYTSPYERQGLHLTVGAGLAAACLVCYWFGSRYRPLGRVGSR